MSAWRSSCRVWDLTSGDPNQVGHQTFIRWIVLPTHVAED